MKFKREDNKEYYKLVKLVDKAEKKAIEFVKKNLPYDSELRLKNPLLQRMSLR
ncbi:MAG: hypothetical protein AAB800_00185 [Patescibacteria group bacterium]|mgnify:CR=1 FL=1